MAQLVAKSADTASGQTLSDCEDSGSNDVKSADTQRTTNWCENKSCIKSDIQSEDGLLVCVNCGQVFNRELNQLKNDPKQEYSLNCRADEIKRYVSTRRHLSNRFPVSKRYNTTDIDRLVANLSLNSSVREEAISKYKHMIIGHFRCSSRSTKTILSAICVYITLIASKTAVTIGHICNTIGCINSEFNKVYNEVMKQFPDYRCEGLPIESLVSVIISETNIDFEEKKILTEKVIQIIELQRQCWLIEGRAPSHIIFAATYLAWMSFKPLERCKVKLTEFCRRVGIEYKRTTNERFTELFNAIKQLSTKLPNHKTEITRANIGCHLNEILRYRSSLVFDFNQQMRQNNGNNDNDCPLSTNEDNPYYKSTEWSTTFKRKAMQSKSSSHTSDSITTECMDKSDEELSDKEINSYIRDENEIKFIKKLKKYSETH